MSQATTTELTKQFELIQNLSQDLTTSSQEQLIEIVKRLKNLVANNEIVTDKIRNQKQEERADLGVHFNASRIYKLDLIEMITKF